MVVVVRRGGPDAEMQMDMAKMFFAVMFGGDKFEPYIGQLGLSAVVDVLAQEMQAAQAGDAPGSSGAGLDLDEMKRTQAKREVSCAVTLARLLARFNPAEPGDFEAWADDTVSGCGTLLRGFEAAPRERVRERRVEKGVPPWGSGKPPAF